MDVGIFLIQVPNRNKIYYYVLAIYHNNNMHFFNNLKESVLNNGLMQISFIDIKISRWMSFVSLESHISTST